MTNRTVMSDLDMQKHIHESNLIEGIDDPAEDKRSLKAWGWLEKQDKIDVIVLLTLHRKITMKQLTKDEAGSFRRVQVWVGNHTPPNPASVPYMVENWLKMFMIDTPQLAHISFERIHPFVDGNGRTGRMLMWWHEMRLGREPTLIRSNEADRQYYYQWFKE